MDVKGPKKRTDNSMLLLDEQSISDKDYGSEANGPNLKKIGQKKEQLLSEIAEEDDVSNMSESKNIKNF